MESVRRTLKNLNDVTRFNQLDLIANMVIMPVLAYFCLQQLILLNNDNDLVSLAGLGFLGVSILALRRFLAVVAEVLKRRKQ